MAELEARERVSAAVREEGDADDALRALVRATASEASADGCALCVENTHGRLEAAYRWPSTGPTSTELIDLAKRAAFHEPGRAAAPLSRVSGERGALVLWRKDGAAFDSASLTLLELAARHGGDVLASGRAEMRGLLAREIHHRVKNNLQTVASLLRLAANDDDPKRALRDSIGRVLAIAEVHDLLTETRDGDVDSADLIRRLSRMLRQSLGGEVEASALAPILLAPERATPLALCVSELIANALEHGGGKARVELRRDGAFAELQVSDQGAGPAPDADAIRRGQGLRITEALVHSDLHGVLEFAFDAGVQARVRFPLDE